MPDMPVLILGEFQRTLDDRYRLSIPPSLLEAMELGEGVCVLSKERPGALGLWNADRWTRNLEGGVELLRTKLAGGRLEGRVGEVQMLGRLLSTRHRTVTLAGRGRLVIPEGFREFLGAQPGEEVLVVGAALCIEIWRVPQWLDYLAQNMTEFRRLFDSLTT